jgi:hypothetical protein
MRVANRPAEAFAVGHSSSERRAASARSYSRAIQRHAGASGGPGPTFIGRSAGAAGCARPSAAKRGTEAFCDSEFHSLHVAE